MLPICFSLKKMIYAREKAGKMGGKKVVISE